MTGFHDPAYAIRILAIELPADSPYVLIVATGVHVLFRLAYLLGVGLMLRKAQLLQNSGRESGHEKWLEFKSKAAFILNADGISLAIVILLTLGTFPDFFPWEVSVLAGALLVLVGIAVKVQAYRAIGVKGYYWYNFFCAGDEREYKTEGVYRYLANPMYSLGYLHAVGFAVAFESALGLVLAVFDWLVVWVFYFLFERPHTLRYSRHLRLRDGVE